MIDETQQFPRALTQREAATLRFILSADDSRLIPLREQAEVASVTGTCPCGCPTIYLAVDRNRARPAVGLPSLATETTSREQTDPRRLFWLLVLLEDGWLAS